jgi:hypothetical protein
LRGGRGGDDGDDGAPTLVSTAVAPPPPVAPASTDLIERVGFPFEESFGSTAGGGVVPIWRRIKLCWPIVQRFVVIQ